MKKYFVFVSLCLLAALGVAQKSYNPYDQQRPTQWQGTGFALNNGYVVTNNHVVDGAKTLVLKRAVGDSVIQYTGEVVGTDEEHDLAIIKVQETNKAWGTLPYSLKTQLSEVGESVFVLGYPMASILGDEIKLTTGVVSSRTGYQGDASMYQISAPIQPGNSGGPLFDNDGNVVGVVNAKVIEEHAENVGYAIKAKHLRELLVSLSLEKNLPTTNSMAGDLPAKVKKAKSFVFSIEASSQGIVSKSSNPKYGAAVIPTGDKVVALPYVDFAKTSKARIDKITIGTKETIVEMTALNDGTYTWININKETYLQVDGQTYKLIRAENIQYAPSKTYLTANKNAKFKLIFGAIPKGATSVSLVEPDDSSWKFYGISLKE